MLNFIKTISVITCALLLHVNAQAAEILIDDFSTTQGPISDLVVGGGGTAGQISTGGSDIIGGYRDIYVEEVDNDVEGVDDDNTLGIHVQVSNGRFSATLDDLVKGFAVITYDGSNFVGDNWANVETNGLGSQDWSGTTGFLFEDVSNDVVAPVQLIVWTNDSLDGATFEKHILDFTTFGDINDGGLYDALVPVTWFEDAASINWASVGAFQAIFNLDSTGDLANSEISVDLSLSRAVAVEVPEPTALSIFGAGLLVLGFVGYKRRKTSK